MVFPVSMKCTRTVALLAFAVGGSINGIDAFQQIRMVPSVHHGARLPSTVSTALFVEKIREETSKTTSDQETVTPPVAPRPMNETNYLESPFYLDRSKPGGAPTLAMENFFRQGSMIVEQIYNEVLGDKSQQDVCPPACLRLHLSNEAVKEAERLREAGPGGKVEANMVARGLYDFGCLMLDTLFDERPIQRFWFLEVVARIPYFSYISMLHLYESLGWWRGSELRKVHNAEEWNELHHLLIMEALGGNALWSDRFLGYHAAIVYYWLLNVVFFFSPRIAYQFMEVSNVKWDVLAGSVL